MLELINLSTWPEQLEYFRSRQGGLAGFLREFDLDGVELIQAGPIEIPSYLKPYIRGWHLPFWPDWLDFYCGNTDTLAFSFPDEECLSYYYGSTDPRELARIWARELSQAEALGAEYAVIHVANCTNRESFSYSFAAGDREVAEGFVLLLNEALANLKGSSFRGRLKILLENLWWPGMTLLDPQIVRYLLENISYPRLGLVLDSSHLMNTNPSLTSQREAAAYILKVIDGLGPLASRIEAVHLNSSLSGSYVMDTKRRDEKGREPFSPPENLWDFQNVFAKVSRHVSRIDPHLPFFDPSIRDILKKIRPAYLVHELIQAEPGASLESLGRQTALFRPRKK